MADFFSHLSTWLSIMMPLLVREILAIAAYVVAIVLFAIMAWDFIGIIVAFIKDDDDDMNYGGRHEVVGYLPMEAWRWLRTFLLCIVLIVLAGILV